ncbi:MAG: hypothetical protein EP301_10845 [Gammaproteobacteria bacterium]|nr:MAG: hypothetical protein EP301_10845 [Gammaproteobacteria bacterium]
MKLILTVLGILFGSMALAAESTYSGINLNQANAVQMQLCTLKPGKSMANYERVVNNYIEWSEENDVEVFFIRAMPLFVSANPNGGPQFDFMEILISPFDVSGNGWSKWLGTEEGQKLNEQWQDTADCRVSMNSGRIHVIDEQALANTDERAMTFNWCSRNEGVSVEQLVAKHAQMASGWTTASPVKAWLTMVPGLGSRNTPGDFAHILSFDSVNSLMAWQNEQANEEGWRNRMDYETSYAACTGDNAYYGRVLNRPGS